MPLAPSNFIRPEGRLKDSWLEDLETLLEDLILQAQDLTTNERAQKAWVYARVYEMLADEMMYEASTIHSDDVKEVRSLGQMRYWARLSEKFQQDYQALMGRGYSGETSVIPTW